jgi:formylglycine-generating enzyme required for sulfatase activity
MHTEALKSRPAAFFLVLFMYTVVGSARGLSAAQAAPLSAATPDLKAVEVIDLGSGVKMEFVLIKPGSFLMGSESGHNDEKPAHRVTLTRPFYLGRCEVTQDQWQRVMGSNPSGFKGANLPVENVSWNDCQDFLAKLQKQTGRQFTLPTEAQWEYACRAGTTNTFSCGDDEASLSRHAWHAFNSGGKTHPVGQKKPNPWGLYDMHGNVFEWCADWYSESYPGGDAMNPTGAGSGDRRIIRGGAWLYIPDNLRSADRSFSPPDYRVNEYGLRCVWLADQPASVAGNRQHNGTSAQPLKAPSMIVRPGTASAGLKKNLVIELGRGVTMELVLIPPGSFTMGSKQSKYSSERPAHQVTITRPFYLAKYEVTQEQWETVMGSNMNASIFKGPGYSESRKRPVENVRWIDCRSFVAKLNEKIQNYEFRLPTEAEWEYACRAGADAEFSFGGDEVALDDYAWFGRNASCQTHPVGGKKPNAWGLYDMHGNVWEWCADWYGPYAGDPVSDPLCVNPDSERGRVARGGAWNSLPDHLRSGYRHDVGPEEMMNCYGFRCVAAIRPAP